MECVGHVRVQQHTTLTSPSVRHRNMMGTCSVNVNQFRDARILVLSQILLEDSQSTCVCTDDSVCTDVSIVIGSGYTSVNGDSCVCPGVLIIDSCRCISVRSDGTGCT